MYGSVVPSWLVSHADLLLGCKIGEGMERINEAEIAWLNSLWLILSPERGVLVLPGGLDHDPLWPPL